MVDLKVISTSAFKMMTKNGVVISYGFHDTRFGKCLLGVMDGHICFLSFPGQSESKALVDLSSDWQGATFVEDQVKTSPLISKVFADRESKPVSVMLKGTAFQHKVWEALLKIPGGTVMSYEKFASMIGSPTAVRASANAIARNPVSYVIPCHRVVSKSGSVHKYRWGADKKKVILDYEKTLLCS